MNNNFFTRFLIMVLILSHYLVYSQVGINTSSPNSKSILDVVSTTKGLLTPRMSSANRNTIAPTSTENGLLLYNTDTDCFNYWSKINNSWMSLCGSVLPSTINNYILNCSSILVNGNYMVGIPLTGSNTITIQVTGATVNQNYTISTNTVDGISFSAAGTFTSSTQTITLNGTGTPTSPGLEIMTINSNSSNPLTCPATVTITNPSTGTFNGSFGPIWYQAPGTYTNPTDFTNAGTGYGTLASNGIIQLDGKIGSTADTYRPMIKNISGASISYNLYCISPNNLGVTRSGSLANGAKISPVDVDNIVYYGSPAGGGDY
jgi:hypothetical protein